MKQRTGSKNIVANVTTNTWSDAARAAALEAKKAGSAGHMAERANTPEEHDAATTYHRGVAQKVNDSKRGSFADVMSHTDAADKHEAAAAALRPKPKGFSNFARPNDSAAAGSDARGASKYAHQGYLKSPTY